LNDEVREENAAMTSRLTIAVLIVSILNGSQALAEGELQIFNYGSYTSPDLINKFEAAYKIKVTITDYDSNDTALAKVKAGGHGFDIVVPSASFVPIWISEGLVEETRPDLMENFKNMDPRWVDVPFDKGRRYSVPWQWGTTGVIVNKKVYDGDSNTSAIFLDPPDELHQIYGRGAVHRRQSGSQQGSRYASGRQAALAVDKFRRRRQICRRRPGSRHELERRGLSGPLAQS
jgi:spermidine/putrescine transport system substrate-binding protein